MRGKNQLEAQEIYVDLVVKVRLIVPCMGRSHYIYIDMVLRKKKLGYHSHAYTHSLCLF